MRSRICISTMALTLFISSYHHCTNMPHISHISVVILWAGSLHWHQHRPAHESYPHSYTVLILSLCSSRAKPRSWRATGFPGFHCYTAQLNSPHRFPWVSLGWWFQGGRKPRALHPGPGLSVPARFRRGYWRLVCSCTHPGSEPVHMIDSLTALCNPAGRGRGGWRARAWGEAVTGEQALTGQRKSMWSGERGRRGKSGNESVKIFLYQMYVK